MTHCQLGLPIEKPSCSYSTQIFILGAEVCKFVQGSDTHYWHNRYFFTLLIIAPCYLNPAAWFDIAT
jgi:hypothetical protein